ncbi:MFS transporter [Fodinicola acaciae]|uniref:MFS transporter n=1 Tax=Fodinicola acaciae TaxID=2681555 RepID=UPI0013D41B2D|nr:MFS transporter [Fodinicola acaciae]
MATRTTGEHAIAGPTAKSGMTLAVLLVAGFTYGLSSVMVIPALGEIGQRFGVSTGTSSWALTINLLGGTVITPIFARLADRYGRRSMLLVVMGALAIGSAICVAAPSFAALLAGRCLQSAGAAVFPIGFGIISATQPPGRVRLGIGLLSAMTGLGGVGLPLAGVLVGLGGLTALFLPALVLATLTVLGVLAAVPAEPPSSAPVRMDWAGAALLAVALVLMLIGIDRGPEWGWGSIPVLSFLVAGTVAMSAWVRLQHNVPSPLVNMRVFLTRPVLMSNLSAFFIGFGMYAGYVLIPQLVVNPVHAGSGFGWSVTAGGLVLLPAMVLMPLGVQLATRLARRSGPRSLLIASIAIMLVAFCWLAAWRHSPLDLAGASVLLGLGVGAAYAVLPNVIAESVPPADLGVATGINQIVRAVGGAFGTAVSATVLTATAGAQGQPTPAGYTIVFTMLAAGTSLAGLTAGGLTGNQTR